MHDLTALETPRQMETNCASFPWRAYEVALQTRVSSWQRLKDFI